MAASIGIEPQCSAECRTHRTAPLAQAEAGRAACNWLLEELRRFAAWDSAGLVGYSRSAARQWQAASDTGLAVLVADSAGASPGAGRGDGGGAGGGGGARVDLDLSKARAWLEEQVPTFEQILDLEDREDAAGLEAVWADTFEAAGEAEVVRRLRTALAPPAA